LPRSHVFVVVAMSIALSSACGGNGNEAEATDTTETGTTTTTTTTETGPPPITAAEEQWVQDFERLADRLTRASDRVRVYTNAAMSRLAETYSTCLPSLRQAGDPGRLQPAARVAREACKKFQRSASAFREAVAIDEAGVYSQEQADKYNALTDRAIETQGNAINTLEQARARAEQISAALPVD
jgi:hypothetical protein